MELNKILHHPAFPKNLYINPITKRDYFLMTDIRELYEDIACDDEYICVEDFLAQKPHWSEVLYQCIIDAYIDKFMQEEYKNPDGSWKYE